MEVGNKFKKNLCFPKFTSNPCLRRFICSSIFFLIISKLKLLASWIVIISVSSPPLLNIITDTSILSFYNTSPKIIFPFKSGYLTNKFANNFIIKIVIPIFVECSLLYSFINFKRFVISTVLLQNIWLSNGWYHDDIKNFFLDEFN